MTTGSKYVQRSKDRIMPRVIDQRTRFILRTISSGPKDRNLHATDKQPAPRQVQSH